MTLVEVLVSAVLLGVGVAGLMSTASLSLRNQRQSELRSIGLALAQERMADVELLGPSGWATARPNQGTEERDGIAYSWSTQIEQQETLGKLFQVTVQVSWMGPGAGSVELRTFLNDSGDAMQRTQQQTDEAKGSNSSSR